MRHLVAEPAVRVGADLGEGPVWDASRAQLLFVDIPRGRLYAADVSGELELLVEIDRPLGAAIPSESAGEVLLVTADGFSVLHADRSMTPLLDVYSARPDIRFNDAKCDPAGRCFAGSLSLSGAPADGQLRRLDDGPRSEVVLGAIGLSNGLGWSPEGDTFYFTDTLSGRVDSFSYSPEAGRIEGRRPFVSEAAGAPDGICVDDDGGVWVALWNGGRIHRYSPAGVLDAIVEVPVPHVTSCAFGGTDGRTLYITTARTDIDEQTLAGCPRAGDVFAVDTGHTGSPTPRWRPVGPR